jgi:hypothetical protein
MKVYNHENRLAGDQCALLTRELQNSSIYDRQIYNFYYGHDCKCPVLDDFLYENNMVIKDGYGVTTGCTIDTDSELRINGMCTNEREKAQLCTRWHQGVPNLNKGGLAPNTEMKIINGDNTSDIKNCDRITEKNFNRFIPLVGCIANTIQNPKHIVEPWTRGGSHTRNFINETKCLKK